MIYVIVNLDSGCCWNGSSFSDAGDAEFYSYAEALKIRLGIDGKNIAVQLLRGNMFRRSV
jgi:hypothetical protein